MARQVDIDNLTPEDKSYLEQRPWLIPEIEREMGQKFDDIDFGIPPEEKASGSQEYANQSSDEELAGLRRENAELKEKVSELESQLAEATADKQDGDGEEPNGPERETDDEPYDDWDYDDIRKEVEERELEHADNKKVTLMAALRADDESADLTE